MRPTGETGLLHVTTATGAPYGQTPQTRRDPGVSTQAGLGYLRDVLTDTKGNVAQALMRDNGGG